MQRLAKPYVVAETAYNHEGDIDYLYRMVDDIAGMGLNAVKFHLLLNPDSYMQRKHPLQAKIHDWIFTEQQWEDIISYSMGKGLDVVALCDDVESVGFINGLDDDIFALEIHATGLNDWFLLGESIKFNGTVVLGIGGSTIDEIGYAIDILKNGGKNEILLAYGFQSYPTDYADINLSKMVKIRELFNLPVIYADHTSYDDVNNEVVSVVAAAMGFNMLEKHYTPDVGVERIDFQAAVGKEQMLKIKELMSIALTAYGSGELKMSKAELDYGNTGPMKKAVVAKSDIPKGQKLSLDNLWFKRTEEESVIKQNQFLQLIGLETLADIKEDEVVDFSKVRYEFKKVDLESFGVATKDEVEL